MPIKSVCVYCGSRNGNNPSYATAAAELGATLVSEQMRLVYGAGDAGLMGVVARAVQNAGGKTFGVIPEHLVKREIGKRDLDTYVVTETMHERKKVMLYNSDAIVLLPGGLGSLDELFEAVTWSYLGLHNKPIVVLNTNGYWSPLRTLIEHMANEGFADHSTTEQLRWADTPAEAVALLQH